MSDPYAVLRASGGRNRAQMGCVGVGAFGLGAFMIALHAVPLDPSTRSMGLLLLVALYGFALLFMVTGVALGGVAVFRAGRDVADLEALLRDQPHHISRARRMVANRTGIQPADGEAVLGQHQALVESDAGRTWVINASATQVSGILDLVASRCPTAEVGGR